MRGQSLITPLLILGVFILTFVTYFHSISAITQDLGRHILMGDIITTTHTIPKTNLLSYTFPDFPFINHHWGSEVVFYYIYTFFGFTGTLIVTASVSIAAFFLLFFIGLKKNDVLAVSIVSLFSLGILYERTDVRPEAFSMLFFSLFLFLLFKNKEKSTKWIYALIPLQLLWTNMHVYFPIGIATVGLFFIDVLICHPELVSGSIKVRHDMVKQFMPLFVTLIGCSLATLFNPNGIQGALYPFRVFANYGYTIEENQTLFFLWGLFQKRTIAFFFTTVILFFGILFIRAKQTKPLDWLLTIPFIFIGLQAERNVPLTVFALFLPFTYHLSHLLHPLHKKQAFYFAITLCCLLGFFWQILFVTSQKPVDFSVPSGAQTATDFVINRHIKGPFFNNFDIGSYFLFRLYPKEKVFVDGRPEAYPASFFQNTYIPMQQNPDIFAKVDQKYHFNAIFFSHTDQTPWANQFLHDITKNPLWKTVYLDDTVIILVRNSSQNTSLPPLTLQTITPVSQTTQGMYQYLAFFDKIGDTANEIKTAITILQKTPNDCLALSVLTSIYIQTNNQLLSIYPLRYQQLCR
jgi:hypothetical protein